MADPVVARAVPVSGGKNPRPSFLEHAVGLLLEHVAMESAARRTWRFGPLVIVSPAEDAASAAVGPRIAPAARATWAGATLDREIAVAVADDRLDRLAATLAGRRIVVVDRIDRVAAAGQPALVHLLDVGAATGTVWVVSTPVHPAAGFVPQCASRLCAGLIVAAAALPAAGPPPHGKPPSLTRIIRAAARYHDVEPAQIVGPSRSRTVAAARSLAMYLARRLTGRSFQAIGGACGGRDHSTVLHGVRVCGDRLGCDPAFAADVERIVGDLSGPSAASGPTAESRRSNVGSAALARTIRNRRRGRRRTA